MILNCDTTPYAANSSTLINVEKVYISQLSKMGADIQSIIVGYASDLNYYFYNSCTPSEPSMSNYMGVKCPTSCTVNWDKVKSILSSRNLSLENILINALRDEGVNVDSGTGKTTVVTTLDPLMNAGTNAKNVNAALTSGNGIQPAFDVLLDGINLGSLNDKARSFFADPSNNPAIQQAVNVLGYPVPTTTDVYGVLNMRQLYWAAYYSEQYPIPETKSANCGQIGEVLNQLKQEKANIDEGNIEQMYSTYSIEDWKIRAQVVTDITTRFNGMYGQLNCTKQIAVDSSNNTTSSKFLKYTLIGFGAIVLTIVILKISKKG